MNYSPKRFTNPGLLRRVGFPQLIRLLEPHKAFFDTKPDFCWAHDPADFSFEVLAKIMMNLDHTAPAELFESLYFAEFFGNSEFFDHLLEIADENGIHVKDFWTPIDLAIHLWFECRDDLQRCHASLHCRGSVTRPRRFESFFVREEVCSIFAHDDTTIVAIQDDLNQWAENNKRGLGMRIFVFDKGDAVWFMIRHGQPMKRHNTVEEDGGDGCVFFRPEKFDSLIYYPTTGELACGVKTKKERIAYAKAIGAHFFGNADYFAVESGCFKYTLQPLINEGVDLLIRSWDETKVEDAKLVELQIGRSTKNLSLEILRGDDIFTALASLQRNLENESGITIVKAKFKLRLKGGTICSVTIEPPNIGIFDHENEHDTIHDWLLNKGFIVGDRFILLQSKELEYAEQI